MESVKDVKVAGTPGPLNLSCPQQEASCHVLCQHARRDHLQEIRCASLQLSKSDFGLFRKYRFNKTMASGLAIATLVVFLLSIVCIIHPFAIPIILPYLGRKRVPVNLTTAPIIAIIVLWLARCLTTENVSQQGKGYGKFANILLQVRDGIV